MPLTVALFVFVVPSLEMVTSHEETYRAFVEGRLTKGEWTHEAHLVTCWMALRDRTPADALAHLREAITTHNCGIGVANTTTSGYHETLTVYYVTAIDAVGAARPEELFTDVRTDRHAPLEYWTKDRLMSSEARAAWLEPDLAPLPWARVQDSAV